MTNEKTQLPKEGIYFEMTDDQYFALPAFSRSFSETVLFDLQEARHILDNPIEATPAMDLGTAIHSAILEPKKFRELYVKKPHASDCEYEGKKILYTIEDLKPLLASYGIKKATKNKLQLLTELRPFIDPDLYVVWDDVMMSFEFETAAKGKKILEFRDFETIRGIQKNINEDNGAKQIFQGGYPEVTIVWKDPVTGVLCKCRLDYLRSDAIGEVKSFAVKNKKSTLEKVVNREIVVNRYNLQFAVYFDALEIIIDRINAGHAEIFGNVDGGYLKELLSSNIKKSYMVFTRNQAPYQVQIRAIEKKAGGTGSINGYFSVAQDLWREALGIYSQALLSGVWRGPNFSVLQDEDVPGVMYQ